VKAAVLEEIPGELVVGDVEVRNPGPREVLVRTVAAGLCHSDLHFMEGKYVTEVPIVLGHESAGIVEAVGELVTYVQPGDPVVTCVSGFCGSCAYCLAGRPNLCTKVAIAPDPTAGPRLHRGDQTVHQFADLGSFGEQLLVHENFLVKIRDDMPLDKAALIGCGVTTGIGAVMNTAKVRPGETVAVIGCGGIGLNAVQAAALVGAGRVIAVDRIASKLDLARTFGATDTVDASAGDPVGAVIEMTGGFALLTEKKLQGSNMGSNRFRVDMPQYVDWYMAGKLKLDELVSATMPIEQINDGFARLGSGEVARQLITF